MKCVRGGERVQNPEHFAYVLNGCPLITAIAPSTTHLDPDHHVEVSLRVLLDDVADVVGLARLLELAPRHKVLDLPDRADRVLVRLSQTAKWEKELQRK